MNNYGIRLGSRMRSIADWVTHGINWEQLTEDDHPLHRLKIKAWQLGVPEKWASLAWRSARLKHSAALRVSLETIDSDWPLTEIVERQAARALEDSVQRGESALLFGLTIEEAAANLRTDLRSLTEEGARGGR